MSKHQRLEILAKFIGLRVAHQILMKLSRKPESIVGLLTEADHYGDLIEDLVGGHWNLEDKERIRELAEKRCRKKLEEYRDLGNEKFGMIEEFIDNLMRDLGLVE